MNENKIEVDFEFIIMKILKDFSPLDSKFDYLIMRTKPAPTIAIFRLASLVPLVDAYFSMALFENFVSFVYTLIKSLSC